MAASTTVATASSSVSMTSDSELAATAEARHYFADVGKGLTMPLIHISLRAGKPEAYRQAIFDSLYRAMRSRYPKTTSS